MPRFRRASNTRVKIPQSEPFLYRGELLDSSEQCQLWLQSSRVVCLYYPPRFFSLQGAVYRLCWFVLSRPVEFHSTVVFSSGRDEEPMYSSFIDRNVKFVKMQEAWSSFNMVAPVMNLCIVISRGGLRFVEIILEEVSVVAVPVGYA